MSYFISKATGFEDYTYYWGDPTYEDIQAAKDSVEAFIRDSAGYYQVAKDWHENNSVWSLVVKYRPLGAMREKRIVFSVVTTPNLPKDGKCFLADLDEPYMEGYDLVLSGVAEAVKITDEMIERDSGIYEKRWHYHEDFRLWRCVLWFDPHDSYNVEYWLKPAPESA